MPTLETNLKDPKTPLEQEIADLGPWFHNLHLPGDVQTAPEHPLGDFPAEQWQHIAPHLPDNLSNFRVLDIGCNAGFYCFECAKRGARVIGMDSGSKYLRQARWAAAQLGHETIEFVEQDIYEISELDGSFDVVFFMGVFYHLRYPLLALDLVAQKVSGLLIFQTLTMPGDDEIVPILDLPIHQREPLLDPGWPKMAFIEHSIAGDPSNWWVPNQAAIRAMLRTAGFEIVARPAREIYLCNKRQTTETARR